MLFSCEPVESSPGLSKEQAVSQLKTATENLKTAIEDEVKFRKAYVASVPVGQKVETTMLRLLRRIVVLGVTPDEAYTDWKGKQKVVETRQGEVNSAVATLRNAGGAEEADTAQKATKTVTDALYRVRRLDKLEDMDALKDAGKNVKKLTAEAVTAVSNLFSSGGLVYAVGNGTDDYDNWKWYVITESGNTESLPIDKILKVTENWWPVAGLKDYWFSAKRGKFSLLRRKDGKISRWQNQTLPEKTLIFLLFIEMVMCITKFIFGLRIPEANTIKTKGKKAFINPQSTGFRFRHPLRNLCTKAERAL